MSADWNLDRKPTSFERAVGVICALVLCFVGGAFLWLSVIFLKSVVAIFFAAGFTLFSCYLAYHFACTPGRKMSLRVVGLTAKTLTVSGSVALLLAVLEKDTASRLLLISSGLFCIAGGLRNLAKSKSKPNQPVQTRPTNRPV